MLTLTKSYTTLSEHGQGSGVRGQGLCHFTSKSRFVSSRMVGASLKVSILVIYYRNIHRESTSHNGIIDARKGAGNRRKEYCYYCYYCTSCSVVGTDLHVLLYHLHDNCVLQKSFARTKFSLESRVATVILSVFKHPSEPILQGSWSFSVTEPSTQRDLCGIAAGSSGSSCKYQP